MDKRQNSRIKESGIGLVEVMVSMAIFALAAISVFSILSYADHQNNAMAQSWNGMQSAMSAWSQTTVPISSAPSVAVTVSGNSGEQIESVQIAETGGTGNTYGWWKASDD